MPPIQTDNDDQLRQYLLANAQIEIYMPGDTVIVLNTEPAALNGEMFPFDEGMRRRVLNVSPNGYAIRIEGDDRFWHISRFTHVPTVLH